MKKIIAFIALSSLLSGCSILTPQDLASRYSSSSSHTSSSSSSGHGNTSSTGGVGPSTSGSEPSESSSGDTTSGGGGSQDSQILQQVANTASLGVRLSDQTWFGSGTTPYLQGYLNDRVRLMTSYEYSTNYNISISWSPIDGSEKIKSAIHYYSYYEVSFNYGTINNPSAGTFSTSYVAFEATLSLNYSSLKCTYIIALDNNKPIYDTMSIAELHSLNGDKYSFQDDDYNIMGNHNQEYYYVGVSGKLEYITPDCNFAILSDGEHSIEMYGGSTTSLDYDKLTVGNYYTVYGRLSNYLGQMQLIYCNYIETISDPSSISEPVPYGEMAEGMCDSASENFVPFYSGITSRFASLSGVYVKELRDTHGNVIPFSSFTMMSRQYLIVTKGEYDFTIYYDYHVVVCKESLAYYYENIIRNLNVNDRISVQGVIRYRNESDGTISPGGVYTLTPYQESHLVHLA